MSTLLEALRQKADVQSYHTSSNRLILRGREKALGNTDDHPQRVALIAVYTSTSSQSIELL